MTKDLIFAFDNGADNLHWDLPALLHPAHTSLTFTNLRWLVEMQPPE